MTELSIIIPLYNEEKRLPGALEKVTAWCRDKAHRNISTELILVDNGSQDLTGELVTQAEAAQAYPAHPPNLAVRALRLPIRGKGAAVRTGMLAAWGELRYMADVDFSCDINELDRFMGAMYTYPGASVIIGSRELPRSVVIGEPDRRRQMGRVYNRLVRWFVLPGYRDTQCGFKLFRAAAAEQLFGRMTRLGFGFDVEILYLAQRIGYPVFELPVTWTYDPDSRVDPLRDAWRMFLDLLAINRNLITGQYDLHPEAIHARH